MKVRAAVAGVFLLALQLLLASYFLDDADGANGMSRAIPPVTWVLNGTWAVDAFAHFTQDVCVIDGHAYSDKAPLSSWVVVPFVWLGKALGLGFKKLNLRSVLQALMVGNVVTGSLPFAGAVILLARRVDGIGYPQVNPIMWASTLLYGTFLWAYAGTYFGHMMAAFFVLGASVLLTKDKPVLAGFAAGAAMLTEYPTAVAFAVWFAQSLIARRNDRALRLCLGFLPAVAILAFYNQTLTHSPFTLTYKYTAAPQFSAMHEMYGFNIPTPRVIYELLLGPRRGLLFFAPVLLWATGSAVMRHGAESFKRALMHPQVCPGLVLFFINASYFVWSGGESFGPRHLVVACLLWAYAALPVFAATPRPRVPFYLAVTTMVLVWADKATRTHVIPPDLPPWRAIWPNIEMLYFNDNALPIQWGLTTALIATGLWLPVYWFGTWASCKLYNQCWRRT